MRRALSGALAELLDALERLQGEYALPQVRTAPSPLQFLEKVPQACRSDTWPHGLLTCADAVNHGASSPEVFNKYQA